MEFNISAHELRTNHRSNFRHRENVMDCIHSYHIRIFTTCAFAREITGDRKTISFLVLVLYECTGLGFRVNNENHRSSCDSCICLSQSIVMIIQKNNLR